jgi:hypothetical protein
LDNVEEPTGWKRHAVTLRNRWVVHILRWCGDIDFYGDRGNANSVAFSRMGGMVMSETIARQRIWEIMKDGRWRSLPEIERLLGHRHMTTSIGARLRDFRKKKFGAYEVPLRRRPGQPNTYEYRLVVPGVPEPPPPTRVRRGYPKAPPPQSVPGQAYLFSMV